MARRIPRSITDQKEVPSIKESFKALKTVPRLFKEIYKTNPALFIANLSGRLLNSFTPVVVLWIGKMIIDEIILQVSLADKDLSLLWKLVAIEFGVVRSEERRVGTECSGSSVRDDR